MSLNLKFTVSKVLNTLFLNLNGKEAVLNSGLAFYSSMVDWQGNNLCCSLTHILLIFFSNMVYPMRLDVVPCATVGPVVYPF